MMSRKNIILMAALVPLVAACSTGPYVENPTPVSFAIDQSTQRESRDYRLSAGDELEVRFFYNPELNVTATVRPDGKISLPVAGEVKASGMTVAGLQDSLRASYEEVLVRPDVSVIVQTFQAYKVFVGGEVGEPGVFDTFGDTTVMQAIAQAGGFEDTGRMYEVVVLRRDDDRRVRYTIPVDVEKALRGTDPAQDIYLEPYDIVFVPKTPIANANLFVEQYIRNMLPIPEAAAFLALL